MSLGHFGALQRMASLNKKQDEYDEHIQKKRSSQVRQGTTLDDYCAGGFE
jgi:hypothetical protein